MTIADKEPRWAIGLMTGTVLDGNIDVALVRTDGERIAEFGDFKLAPYKTSTIELLRQTLTQAREWQFDGAEPALFSRVERLISEEQSTAVIDLVRDAGLSRDDIGGVGFHGQTVLHRAPAKGRQGQTRQLGDGALMARLTGLPVVNDFRSRDMRFGGQGAPLAATYHRALLQRTDASSGTAVLNVGGVANLTWWDGADQLVSFDTGPGNAPINDFIRARSGEQMDVDGLYALAGVVDEKLLNTMLEHEYLREPFPKSLDRFDFNWARAEGLAIEDGAALLTAFSACAVGSALALLPSQPARLVVCGGGRRNPALMKYLEKYTSTIVSSAEAVGWRGDAVEAECFGFLAMRTLRGLPTSFPMTTGASEPVCGGVIHQP